METKPKPQPLSTTLLATNGFICKICRSTSEAQPAMEAKAADEQISMEAGLRLPQNLLCAPIVAPVSSLSTFPPVVAPVPAPGSQAFLVNGGNFHVEDPASGQWPTMQHQQPSLYPATRIQSAG
ncbi:hypothetical protein ACFX14_000669 [Malus domestica]